MVVKLEMSDNRLDEVIVTGYGTGKKLGSAVGSLNVVNEDTILFNKFTNFSSYRLIDLIAEFDILLRVHHFNLILNRRRPTYVSTDSDLSLLSEFTFFRSNHDNTISRGSLNVVNEDVFANSPAPNFVDALQGQVPGLSIFSNTGEPSATPANIRIRGVNS